jgi:hypothetical protein
MAVFTWSSGARFDKDRATVTPPAGAQRITLAALVDHRRAALRICSIQLCPTSNLE